MVGTALAIKQILDRISVKMLSIALLANAAIISLATPRVVLPVQRQVLAAAHEIMIGTPAIRNLIRENKIRSEEQTSELQSLMRISYAVFCLKTKKALHTVNHQSMYRNHITKYTLTINPH